MPKKRKTSKADEIKTRWQRFFPEIVQAKEEEQIQQQELNALQLKNKDAPRSSLLDHYKDHPLAQSMLARESTRNQTLIRDGRKQGDSVMSNHGWIKTLFVLEVRAPDQLRVCAPASFLTHSFITIDPITGSRTR